MGRYVPRPRANFGAVQPRVLFTKHKYTKIIGPADWSTFGTGNEGASIRVHGNDIFDPDPQLGGLQAYGMFELTGLYDTFVVYASSVRVRLWNDTDTLGGRTAWTVFTENAIDDATASITNPLLQMFDSPFMRCRAMLSKSNAGRSTAVFGAFSTTAKAMEIPRARVVSDPDYWGGATFSPSVRWTWTVAGVNLTGAAGAPTAFTSNYGLVTVTYYVRWSGSDRFHPRA